MDINLEEAKIICKQSLPFSVFKKMSNVEIIGSANSILLFSAGFIQKTQMYDMDMNISVKYKKTNCS